MKIMNVSFAIDVKNVEHVNALSKFMAILGEHPATTSTGPNTEAVEIQIPAQEVKKTKSKVAAPVQEVEKVEAAAPIEKTAIDLEMLRGIVSTLVKSDSEKREKIKAKLESFGVTSVSTLSEDDYAEFHTYLKTL